MFELIALGIAGATGIYGHMKSRKFVGQRLRYTNIVEKPMLGLWTGLAAAIIAAPVAFLPLVGPSIALGAGLGVGTGVSLGVKDAKEPPLLED